MHTNHVPAHRLSALHPTRIWWVGNANLPPQERGHCKWLALFISSEPKESFSFQVQVKSTDPEICSYVIERKISKGPNVRKFSKIFQTKAAIEQRFKQKVLWLQTEYKLQISSSYFIWTSSWDQTHLSGNKRYEDKSERKKKISGQTPDVFPLWSLHGRPASDTLTQGWTQVSPTPTFGTVSDKTQEHSLRMIIICPTLWTL